MNRILPAQRLSPQQLPTLYHRHHLVIGVDEVGRGCLAGPVTAAALCWHPNAAIPLHPPKPANSPANSSTETPTPPIPLAADQVRDSKTLSAPQRQKLAATIGQQAHFALGQASVAEIDQINILRASLLAMSRALDGLATLLQPWLASPPHTPLFSSLLEPTKPATASLAPIPSVAVVVDGTHAPTLPAALNHGHIHLYTLVNGDGLMPQVAAAAIMAKVARDQHLSDLAREFPAYGWDSNKGYGSRQHLDALTTHGITPHHRRSFAPVRNAA